MDVKVGSGAFLPERAAAQELACSIVTTARAAGLPCTALLTDMSQCLGSTAGNALEVAEALAVLRGGSGDGRLLEVTLALAAEALCLSGLASDTESAASRARRVLASGAAAERFGRMVRGLGGPAGLIDAPRLHLPEAPVRVPAVAPRRGHVVAVDGRALGLAIVALGGGRRQVTDGIDPAVGLSEVRGVGAIVGAGEPLAHGACARC